jgi:hypothetical protein
MLNAWDLSSSTGKKIMSCLRVLCRPIYTMQHYTIHATEYPEIDRIHGIHSERTKILPVSVTTINT